MKKLLLKIHIYGGLLFLPYLLAFGLSTLHINHDFGIFRENQGWTGSKEKINIVTIDDDQQLAESIRDSLGLMGWCPWWTQNRNGHRYTFTVTHFGAEYLINANTDSGELKVQRRAKGFWNIFSSLHFLGEKVPRAGGVINFWRYYQDLTVVYLVLAIVSGIYLFLANEQEKETGKRILLTFLLLSFFFMFYIWRIG